MSKLDGFKEMLIISKTKKPNLPEAIRDENLEVARLKQFVEAHGLQTANVDYDVSVGSDGILPDERILEDNTPFDFSTGISSRIVRGEHSVRWDGTKRTGEYMMHLPVLDIDKDAVLVQSSTPGHHHLIINKPMSERDYLSLLDVLSRFGIIEPGYAGASRRRKGSWIRTPWTKKQGAELENTPLQIPPPSE